MKFASGSCICQSVTYELSGTVKKVVNCHCNLCRKMNGAAFSTYAAVLESEFRLISGELQECRVSEHATKHFCQCCGTPIYNTNPKIPGLKILHWGTLNNALELTPEVNLYCESEVDWVADVKSIMSLQKGLGA